MTSVTAMFMAVNLAGPIKTETMWSVGVKIEVTVMIHPMVYTDNTCSMYVSTSKYSTNIHAQYI